MSASVRTKHAFATGLAVVMTGGGLAAVAAPANADDRERHLHLHRSLAKRSDLRVDDRQQRAGQDVRRRHGQRHRRLDVDPAAGWRSRPTTAPGPVLRRHVAAKGDASSGAEIAGQRDDPRRPRWVTRRRRPTSRSRPSPRAIPFKPTTRGPGPGRRATSPPRSTSTKPDGTRGVRPVDLTASASGKAPRDRHRRRRRQVDAPRSRWPRHCWVRRRR